MSNDYAIHQKTQRQIEKEFKLRPMLARGRDFKQWEVEWAKRYKFDIFKLREEITADFKSSKSGQKFMDSLKDKGVVLCRGDKSQFVLVLPWGQHKALSSMIHGRPIKAVLRRSFADIDIAKLPTVTEGKSQVRASLPKLGDKPRRSGRIYIRGGSTQTGSWQPYAVLRAAHQPKLSSTMETTGTTPVAPNKISANRKIEKQKPPLRPEEIEDDEKISLGRAEAAYKDEFDRWEGLIKAAASDLGLSKDQRLAGVAALRSRQRAAAKAAYKRVVNEEKAIAKAARRAKRVLLGFPEPPPSSR